MKTEGGLVGDAIQDVVTNPPEKHVRVQGSNGYLDWYVNRTPGADTVIVGEGDQVDERVLPKTRADDFKVEVDHLAAVLEGRVTSSPISLERGLDTMMVIAAAFKSHKEGRRVSIDWAAGYRPEALQ
jgi:predicted dehydrogenase